MVVGDSISTAYGMDIDQGWVALLQKQINQDSYTCKIINTSISGDTSAGGAARIDQHLSEYHPRIVILELGGNDGLRGLPPYIIKKNLKAMVDRSHASGAAVVLLGIRIPPNYGKAYTTRFEQIYYQLADETEVGFVPFLLKGIGDNTELMQHDGIHPNSTAQHLIMEMVWKQLKPILKKNIS